MNVVVQPDGGPTVEILTSPVLVGSGSQCDLVIEDPSVSAAHAEVVRRDGQVYVRDLASKNGTTINGERVDGEAMLQPSDWVMFGAVPFVLDGTRLIEAETHAHAPTPDTSDAGNLGAVSPKPSPSEAAAAPVELISADLVRLLLRLLWGYVGLLGAMMLTTILLFASYEQTVAGNRGAADSWQTWDTIYATLFVVSVVLSIPIFALLVAWSDQTHRATDWLHPLERQWVRGWAIGAWFIPLANLILVPLILGEIRKIATAARSNGKVGSTWQREGESSALLLWFVFYAPGLVFLWYGDAALDKVFDAEQYRNGLMMVLIGLGLTGAGATLAVTFIRDVSTKLGVDSGATA
ncbi:MAG: FHA domain-containing protein [Acidimicrobiales bacterium]